MSDLRIGLGGHKQSTGPLPEFGLTLHELGELIRRAGHASGFVVQSEYKVRPTSEAKGKIDWVWLSGESLKPVLAFEIEGRDVSPGSINADVAKFRACGAAINVIALFQVDHNRTPKRLPPRGLTPQNWVREFTRDAPIEIMLDEELMVGGGIERLQDRALDSKF